MSDKPQSVTLMIMGKEYKILCDLDEQDDLTYSAQQLDQQMRKMRDSGKVNGAERIAVLAALNLAHELQVLKNQNAMLKLSLNEALKNLSNKVENVLEKP
ncbi:cell division protein ZapA [Methylosoma difficile]